MDTQLVSHNIVVLQTMLYGTTAISSPTRIPLSSPLLTPSPHPSPSHSIETMPRNLDSMLGMTSDFEATTSIRRPTSS